MTSWSTWRCSGVTAKGFPCRHMLAEIELVPGAAVRIKCPYCKALNIQRCEGPQPLMQEAALRAFEMVGSVGR